MSRLEGQAPIQRLAKAVAESCDVVCSMLPYNQAVQAVVWQRWTA